MNLSTSPMSTPHAGGFTVTSHTGYSSRGPYALEGGGATSPSTSASNYTPGVSTGPNGITPSLPGANVSSTPSGQYHSTSHYQSIGHGGMVTGLLVVFWPETHRIAE